jgi:hypothetical protein
LAAVLIACGQACQETCEVGGAARCVDTKVEICQLVGSRSLVWREEADCAKVNGLCFIDEARQKSRYCIIQGADAAVDASADASREDAGGDAD